jgi:hypothetical protein
MKKLLLLWAAIIIGGLGAMGQGTDLSEYKSLFIINFLRYVNWPAENKGDFVMGVVKNKALAADLASKTNGKKVGFSNIVVKEFDGVDNISGCHLLYISADANYPKNAEVISQKVKGFNTLIVTECNGAIKKGSAINFVIIDNNLKFEISPNNAENNGLKISSVLLTKNNAIVM